MDLPLINACMNNDLRKVQETVETSPGDLLKRDGDGRIALHWAVSFQHEEIVLYLLSHMRSVDLNEYRDDSGWTPFHIACAVGSLSIVKELYERVIKPDLNLQTNQGVTPLHLAVSKKHVPVCQFLLDHKASVRVKDSRQQMPIHRAAAIGSPVLVELLCKKNSPVNAADNNGWTPLFHAFAEGHGDVAVMLVEKFGADDQLQDPKGLKAIDYALNEQIKNYYKNHVS
ncbi:hypothetical protein HG536_0A01200 [Torulaspora globosa]|uniref:Uncharacterized protein n=1 Tax=Torulaspora globosa TaxID=48254 RepID=A0A7G3Z9W7_9SACH|nr:uncharacterized protein HG536_0A01200 [Torulaspora globosa]QLL30303.1 hypothetical protein HG536_0A01200 [Torulaspora globosa]